jgi:hypothetical protein
VTIAADATGVPGATADTASLTIAVTGSPSPTPSPPTCDLIDNGKCYRRIVDRTSHTFFKHVVPDDNCLTVPSGSPCNFIDSIKQIYLEPGFGFQTPVPPTDSDHQTLIRIDSIVGVTMSCLPYAAFAENNPGIPILFGGNYTVGAPVNPADGLGEPSLFTTSNHLISDAAPEGSFDLGRSWNRPTRLADLFSALANGIIGFPFITMYFASDTTAGKYVQFHPDFAGCDAAGDATFPGVVEYGDAGVTLLLEVYQTVP